MVDDSAVRIKPYRYYERGHYSPNGIQGKSFEVLVLKVACPDGPAIEVLTASGSVIAEQEIANQLQSRGFSCEQVGLKRLVDDLNLMRVTCHGREAAKSAEYLNLPFERILDAINVLKTDIPKIISSKYLKKPAQIGYLAMLRDLADERDLVFRTGARKQRSEPWNHDAVYIATILWHISNRSGSDPGLTIDTGRGVRLIEYCLDRAQVRHGEASAIVSAWKRYKKGELTF